MPTIIYTGPHDAVTLADGTVAANGEPTDVSEEIAQRYVERDDFHLAASELRSLTHAELDELAGDVDDYPWSGTKDDKIAALQSAGVTPEPAGDGEEA